MDACLVGAQGGRIITCMMLIMAFLGDTLRLLVFSHGLPVNLTFFSVTHQQHAFLCLFPQIPRK
jgi:hypothetical protein